MGFRLLAFKLLPPLLILFTGCGRSALDSVDEDGVTEDAGEDSSDSSDEGDAAEDGDATSDGDATINDGGEDVDGDYRCSVSSFRTMRCGLAGCFVDPVLPDGCCYYPDLNGVVLMTEKECFEAYCQRACPLIIDPDSGMNIDFSIEMAVFLEVWMNPWCNLLIIPTAVESCDDHILIHYNVEVIPQDCAAIGSVVQVIALPRSELPVEATMDDVYGCPDYMTDAECRRTVHPGDYFCQPCGG